jgi:TolB protein
MTRLGGMKGRLRRAMGRGLEITGGGAVAAALLALSATIALALPAVAVLSELPSGAGVAYGSGSGQRFAPLSNRFLRDILGLGAVPQGPDGGAGLNSRGRDSGSGSTTQQAGITATVVDHPFTNDNFASAYTITTVPFIAHTNMAGATREPGEPGYCAAAGGTAWYRFMPPSSRVVNISVLTTFPTALDVFRAPVRATDQGHCVRGDQRNAAITILPTPGAVYYIQVTALTVGGPLTLKLAYPGPNELESLNASGAPGDADSGGVSTQGVALSRDGGVVAFESTATNLDPAHPLGPCNPFADPATLQTTSCTQVYVRDRSRHTTELISHSASGSSGDASALQPSISADGRYVAFSSAATNLVPGDTNGVSDVFVYDRTAHRLTRETVTAGGGQLTSVPGNAGSFIGRLSPDGRFLAFTSDAINLPGNDACNPATQNCLSVFLRDRLTGATTEVNVDPAGKPVTDDQPFPSAVSSGGRYVLFQSASAQVLPGSEATCKVQSNPGGSGVQGGNCLQVYRRDMFQRRTILGTASSKGIPGNNSTSLHSVSMTSDGRFMAFASLADNLIDGDTNKAIDSFRHDFDTGQTLRVSVDSGGGQVNDTNANGALGNANSAGGGSAPRFTSIADGGDVVTFDSAAPELNRLDTVNLPLAYVHVVSSGLTNLLGIGPQGVVSGGEPVTSADGAYTALGASNLNDQSTSSIQVFLHLMTEVQ